MDKNAYIATSSGSSSSSFISSFPIRAPPTLDSDTESSLSSEGYKNENSVSNSGNYGSDVSGFLSGEDEFETASERPFVADPDDESAESRDLFCNHVGFRPFSNDPSGENNEFGVFKAFVGGTSGAGISVRAIEGDNPYEDSVENDSFFEDTGVFKPFEGDPDGEMDESGVSRAFVSITSGERTSVKSIEEGIYGDFGAKLDNGLNRNGDFVENHVVFRPFVNYLSGENDRNGVSKAYVSATSGEVLSTKSIEEDNDGYFGSGLDDNLSDNGEFAEDTVVIRCLVNDPRGQIKENEVSRSYVTVRGEEEKTSAKHINEGKYRDFGESSVVDIGILAIPKLITPTAKLSRDSDDESLLFEDVEDGEFEPESDEKLIEKQEMSENVVESMELKGGEMVVAGEVFPDEKLEKEKEEDGSNFERELDEKLFQKMSENVVESMELQEGDVVASGAVYTCSFVDETKGTISTKLLEKSEDSVIVDEDKNDLTDGIKDSKFIETDSAYPEKMENLSAEMENGQRKSFDVSSPLLKSTLDLEFSGEYEDKEGYGKGNSERSFSIDDYSNDSIMDDIELTSSHSALEESSKDFGPKTERNFNGDFFNEVDTHEERKENEVFNPSTSELSPNQNLSEEQRKNIEKIQLIRVKFLRLVQRLGLSIEDSIASQVLYWLNLIERGPLNQLSTFVSAMNTAMELGNGKFDSDLSLNVFVLGKTGVGKSATINSILSEEKASVTVSACETTTTSVKEITGVISGIKVRIIDTPGLRLSSKEQSFNMKVLSSAERLMRKYPPDIVLYMDRLDMETSDFDDLPLLKSITRCLGSSIWEKTIITLTHAGSTPPDGPNGLPLSYDLYVAQRLRKVQVMITRSLGRNMFNSSSVCSVSLVENHSLFQEENGEKVLLTGEKWKPRLLLLCASMKILSLIEKKNQDFFGHRKVFGVKVGSLPIPDLLSSLLHANSHLKTPSEWALSAFDQEDEDDYDQLPLFKLLPETLEKNKDFLNGPDQSLVDLLSVGFSLGRGSNMVIQAGLDDKLNGKVSVKISGLEQCQIALLGIFLAINAILRN